MSIPEKKRQLLRKIAELENMLQALRRQMKQATAQGNARVVVDLGVKTRNLEVTIQKLRAELARLG